MGLEFNTLAATAPVRVKEVLLDGVLQRDPMHGTAANLVFWDVTDPANPEILPGGIVDAPPRDRNVRNAYPVNVVVPPGRVIRALAHVDMLALSPITGPLLQGVAITGGLGFADPCRAMAPKW
ncbi:MAG: hypothetical protein R3E96_15945 [Planctomycetota bacterium]